jgi:probable rRNA maturation factor
MYIDIQQASDLEPPVPEEVLDEWARLPLRHLQKTGELTLRLVNKDEMISLNHSYRQQNKPTNVLAFPSALPDTVVLDYPLIGDVIICPEVLVEESESLEKPLIAHWAHIVIHGILHLLGYDHIKDSDALVMQALEKELLATLNFDDPYQTEEENLE